MTRYLLIGGAGYVGSRLRARLLQNPENVVHVLDLGLLWPAHVPRPCNEWRDVLDADPKEARWYDVVVWLATIHDVPKAEERAWRSVTAKLMVQRPRLWEAFSRRFVYFSSMRAKTHVNTLYGFRKRCFEVLTTSAPRSSTLVIRPGTVWGDYNPELPNRNHTAINRTLIDPSVSLEVPENHVFMGRLLDTTCRAIGDGTTGIVEAVDPQRWARPELGIHPMAHYRKYYGVTS